MDANCKIITKVNGKLPIVIDLSYSKTELRKAFEEYLSYWWRKPTKNGPREMQLNKWDIYDKRHKEGKNLLEITRELFNVENHPNNLPAFNAKVNSYYQRVKRAYRSAIKILDSVEALDD